jgi:septal ring factor EnvC (AmiA/AmiB activator)
MFGDRSNRAKAAVATACYLTACVALAWFYMMRIDSSNAADAASSAESEVSELRDRLQEMQDEVEQLRDELETLRREVAFR